MESLKVVCGKLAPLQEARGNMFKTHSVHLTVKTPVVITALPVPTLAAQEQIETPVISSVLCGILLLLALIPAAFCFIRRGYHKFR